MCPIINISTLDGCGYYIEMMIGLLILLTTYSWYIIPCATSKYNISIILILTLFYRYLHYCTRDTICLPQS